MEIALNAMRIHGGYGYSCEYDVERYFRDAPLMIVGEGTNEIQRNVIAGQLVARGGIWGSNTPDLPVRRRRVLYICLTSHTSKAARE